MGLRFEAINMHHIDDVVRTLIINNQSTNLILASIQHSTFPIHSPSMALASLCISYAVLGDTYSSKSYPLLAVVVSMAFKSYSEKQPASLGLAWLSPRNYFYTGMFLAQSNVRDPSFLIYDPSISILVICLLEHSPFFDADRDFLVLSRRPLKEK